MTPTFGLDIPAMPPEDPVTFYPWIVEAAEAGGFSNLWVGDHLLWHRPRLETFALLGMLSGRSSLMLGTGVALAPLRPPWWTAKSAATLAALNPGGFLLGLGAGGEYAREFELAGVDPAERGGLVDRTMTFCVEAWSGRLGDDFSPQPSRPIPLWVGGRRRPAIRRAARYGDGWTGLFLDPDEFASARALLIRESRASGRAEPTAAMTLWVSVAEDGWLARRSALEILACEYRLSPQKFARHVVAGTPTEVAAAMNAYVLAGADHLALHIAHPDIPGQLDLLATEVLPVVRTVAENELNSWFR